MMNETQADMLIDRIASREEGELEFAQFEQVAADSPAQWERLARTLRDELHLRGALSDALETAGSAEIARAMDRSRETASVESPPAPVIGALRWRTWSGWAVAAALAIAWTIAVIVPRGNEANVPQMAENNEPAVRLAALSADDALEQYLRVGEREGRLVEELPAVLVQSHETEDGDLEVYYLRQFLERDRVLHVYELAEDEHGSFVPVPANLESLLSVPSTL